MKEKITGIGLLLFSFLAIPIFQKMWYHIYLLGLAGMGYGYGVNHQGHAKQFVYKHLGYNKGESKDFIIFDVGANIGQTIHEIIGLGLKKYRIYSFEPQLCAFEKLKEKYHTYKNISVFNVGFGEKADKIPLHKEVEGDTAGSVVKHKNSIHTFSEMVTLQTIDCFVKKHSVQYISYLKMDIEGAEFSALKGAQNSLKKGIIESIEFEFLRQNINARVFMKDFWDLLGNSYDFYRILPHHVYKVNSYSHLQEIYCLSNFICIKKGLKKK